VFSLDTSGFTLHHASQYYYVLRIKRDILSLMRKRVELKEKKKRW